MQRIQEGGLSRLQVRIQMEGGEESVVCCTVDSLRQKQEKEKEEFGRAETNQSGKLGNMD